MQHILLILQVFLAVGLIGVILLQRSSNDGLGLGGSTGGMGSLMSGRASANMLTKATSILATLFIINSLTLAVIASQKPKEASLLEQVEKKAAETPAKAPAAPKEKSKPALPVAR